MQYPILAKSAELWSINRTTIIGQNASLIFHRYAPVWIKEDGFKETEKRDGLQAVISAAAHADKDLLKALVFRWRSLASKSNAEPFSLVTDWRLIPGLGSKGPLEVGFTFDFYGYPSLPGSCLKGLARAMARIEIFEAIGAQDETSLKQLDQILSKEEVDPSHPGKNAFQDAWEQKYPNTDQSVFCKAMDFRMIFGTPAKAGRVLFQSNHCSNG